LGDSNERDETVIFLWLSFIFSLIFSVFFKHCRYNEMIKEEAKEILFWKEMENTNRNQAKKISGKDAWKVEDADQEEENKEQPAGGGKAPGKEEKKDIQGKPQKEGENRSGASDGRGGGGRGSQTNPDAGRGRGGGGGGGGGRGANNKKSESNQDNNKNKDKEGEDTASQSSSSQQQHRKPRTKTFDRHHQKDKALRKTGGF
jgi:hypothetical protein